ncbi:MAG: hypothetical protein II826_03745 [Prevotella sp.]|nr:hypothetical protein [Prevotella sp.]
MSDNDQIEALYREMYKAMVEKDTATLNRVHAAVFGGGRHTWRLQLYFSLVKEDGKWRFTTARASTY